MQNKKLNRCWDSATCQRLDDINMQNSIFSYVPRPAQVNSALHPFGFDKSSITSFDWLGKTENVTSTGQQLTLSNPIMTVREFP